MTEIEFMKDQGEIHLPCKTRSGAPTSAKQCILFQRSHETYLVFPYIYRNKTAAEAEAEATELFRTALQGEVPDELLTGDNLPLRKVSRIRGLRHDSGRMVLPRLP